MSEKKEAKIYDARELVNETNNFSHAYIIESRDYEKGVEFSKFLSKNIICKNYKNDSHKENTCDICNKINNDSYLEINYIEPEGINYKIEKFRNLKQDLNKKALINKNRVYIILNAEKMGEKNSNSMLKFIEEPENNIYCLIVTDNYYSIIPTIRSRCQKIRLNNLPNVDLVTNDGTARQIIDIIEREDNLFLEITSIVNSKNKEESLLILNEMIEIYVKEKTKNWIFKVKKLLKYKKDIVYNLNMNLFWDNIIIELGELVWLM